MRCVYFDEFILVSGSMDKTIKITDMDTEITLSTLTGHKGWVLALKYDLLHIISGSSDKTVKVCINSFTYCWVLSLQSWVTLKLWDFHTGTCLSTFNGHNEAVRCVESGNAQIISGSAGLHFHHYINWYHILDKTVKIWVALSTILNDCCCTWCDCVDELMRFRMHRLNFVKPHWWATVKQSLAAS